MPLLPKSGHERFAQALAKGMSASAAYVAAGYSKNDGNASRLNGNEKIKARVEELLQQGAEEAGVTVQRIVDELAKVGFANMGDFLHATSGGDPFFVYNELTDRQKAALAEVTVEDFKEGRGEDARDVRRVKFKLHDKLSALEKLGKHLGMFRDKVEVTGKDGAPIETRVTNDAFTKLDQGQRDQLRGIAEALAGRPQEPASGA